MCIRLHLGRHLVDLYIIYIYIGWSRIVAKIQSKTYPCHCDYFWIAKFRPPCILYITLFSSPRLRVLWDGRWLSFFKNQFWIWYHMCEKWLYIYTYAMKRLGRIPVTLSRANGHVYNALLYNIFFFLVHPVVVYR